MSPPVLSVLARGIPASLRELPRWVLWRYDPHPVTAGKWSKVPYSPATGRKTNGAAVAYGHPFVDCWRAYRAGGWSGVGFILGDGIGGIDQDDVLDEKRKLVLRPEVSKAFAATYAEVSPGGRGWKGITLLDARVGHVGRGGAGGEEIYSEGRWFAMTGRPLAGHALEVTDQTDAFLAQVVKLKARNSTRADREERPPADRGAHFLQFHVPGAPLAQGIEWLSMLDPDDEEPVWFLRRMLPWQLQYGESGFDAFDDWSSTSWRYEGTASVREKWDRAAGMNAALPINIAPDEVTTMRSIRSDAEEAMKTIDTPTTGKYELETGRQVMKSDERDSTPILGILLLTGVAMLAGEGGTGKSTILATAAACITSGRPMPPWELPTFKRPPGAVLWLTVEEDVRNIVMPRHEKLGGNLDLVYRPKIRRSKDEKTGQWFATDFDIEVDLPPLLDEAIAKGAPIRLVVADSLPGLVQWRNRSPTSDTDVKKLIGRLNDIGLRYGCCIAGIAHWNKKADLAEQHRISGAQAWRDTPRASWSVEHGYIYANKTNDIEERGTTFQQEVVAVLRVIHAVTEDGTNRIEVTARRALFGPFLSKKKDLMGRKANQAEQTQSKEARLLEAARAYLDDDPIGEVDAGDLWAAVCMTLHVSRLQSDEKKYIKTELELHYYRDGGRHVLSMRPRKEPKQPNG